VGCRKNTSCKKGRLLRKRGLESALIADNNPELLCK
jgi:hypothetical protein